MVLWVIARGTDEGETMKRGQRLDYRISFEYETGVNGKWPCPEGAWQAVHHGVRLLERGARIEIQRRREDLTWRTILVAGFGDADYLDFLQELDGKTLGMTPHDGEQVILEALSF